MKSSDVLNRQAVLVVEDDELCRLSVTVLLESSGFSVISVADGESAIKTLQRWGDIIAVVLLDTVLPGLGGVETFQALRRLRNDLPIVLTSGYDERSVIADFEEMQYAGFVPKPGDPAALREILQQFITK